MKWSRGKGVNGYGMGIVIPLLMEVTVVAFCIDACGYYLIGPALSPFVVIAAAACSKKVAERFRYRDTNKREFLLFS